MKLWTPFFKYVLSYVVYISEFQILHYPLFKHKFAGDALYDSAQTFRLSEYPAFALECLPNRNSLVYGDVYGIGDEAATIFRGTLRYEGMPLCLVYSPVHILHNGICQDSNYDTDNISYRAGFSQTMGTLAKIGFFNLDPHPALQKVEKPTFEAFTLKLLGLESGSSADRMGEKEITQKISTAGLSKDEAAALKAAKTIL